MTSNSRYSAASGFFWKRFLGSVQERPPWRWPGLGLRGRCAGESQPPRCFPAFPCPTFETPLDMRRSEGPGGVFHLGKVPAANGIPPLALGLADGERGVLPQGLERLPSILVDGCRILPGKDAVALC